MDPLDSLIKSADRINGIRFSINVIWAIVVLTIFCAGNPDIIDAVVRWLSK